VFLMLSLDTFNLEITVPLYSEHWVLHLHRREERKGMELQSLAHGEVEVPILSRAEICL